MEHRGTFDKYYALGRELEHDDEVIGFEWPNGRWDQQSGRVAAYCTAKIEPVTTEWGYTIDRCGESPEDHPDDHEPEWSFLLDFGDDVLDVLPDATYVIYRQVAHAQDAFDLLDAYHDQFDRYPSEPEEAPT